MVMPLRALAQRCQRLSPLLVAPAALLLTQGQAKAVLTYNIFESGGNLVLETSRSLNLTPTGSTITCGFDGALALTFGVICTGTDKTIETHAISGPNSFSAGTNDFFPADSVSGISTGLDLNSTIFAIENSYVSGTPIVSSATFFGQTLATLGITSFGSLGTWTIVSTGDTITVNATSAPADVPGPLPLLGAGAAFGWSRRLRKRIATPLSTPPQA
jgi:MYXO-CTERM domain-containing protein